MLLRSRIPQCCGEPEGGMSIVPALFALLILIIGVAITEAAKRAISATAVVMTDIIDGVLVFCISGIGLILIALVLWLMSHAGRVMWKYRGDYGLHTKSDPIPVPLVPQTGMYITVNENGIDAVQTEEVNGVHVPMAINPPPAFNATNVVLDDLLTDEEEIPVRVREKSKYSLRRD